MVTCATGESTVETQSMWQRCGTPVTVQSCKGGAVAFVWAGPPISRWQIVALRTQQASLDVASPVYIYTQLVHFILNCNLC